MSIGKNLKALRHQHNMTQKELGIALGFNEKSADVRISQYESGTRKPKEKLIANLARVFGVDISAITAPDMEHYINLIQTLNELESLCRCASQQISDFMTSIDSK